jgi:PAS domain S-box-containing protein
MRRDSIVFASLVEAIEVAMIVGLACVEWRLGAAVRPREAGGSAVLLGVAAALAVLLAHVAAVAAMALYSIRVIGTATNLLLDAAIEIATTGRARVPMLDRGDELGKLARALDMAQKTAAMRDAMVEQAPVGICLTDGEGRVGDANRAAQRMLRRPRTDLVGRNVMELVHRAPLRGPATDRTPEPPDLGVATWSGLREPGAHEARFRRSDGTGLWCSVSVGSLSRGLPGAARHVVILEDVSARKLEAERTALIQRKLLPANTPRLDGYRLAGACLPARDVAGDLYDWVVTEDGSLDVTLADVMGRGLGSALVMARLRTALRSMPARLGVAERVALADEAVTLDVHISPPFVTLFYGRLEPASGLLRYVDAGHGYCVVLRPGGEVVRLAERSLVLGVGLGGAFAEGVVRLEPGDTLLVHSDGLAEAGERIVPEEELVRGLGGMADAVEIVRCLVERAPAERADDVTVIALHGLGP